MPGHVIPGGSLTLSPLLWGEVSTEAEQPVVSQFCGLAEEPLSRTFACSLSFLLISFCLPNLLFALALGFILGFFFN